jgi:hypothetical protein
MVTVDEELGNRTLLKPPGIRLVNFGQISRLSIDRNLAWKGQHGSSPFSGFEERATILRHLFVSQPTEDSGGSAFSMKKFCSKIIVFSVPFWLSAHGHAVDW